MLLVFCALYLDVLIAARSVQAIGGAGHRVEGECPRCAEQQPHRPETFTKDELGDAENAEWAYTAAIDAIREQNGWTRELAKAYRWYGKFLKRMGRGDAALEAFELAADLAPSNQDAMAPTPQSGVGTTITNPQ